MSSKKEQVKCSKKCTTCLEWLEHCDAECCKQFSMKKEILKKRRGGYTTTIPINNDFLNYALLHGCGYTPDKKLFIETYKYQMEDNGDSIIFHRPCNALDDDNHCNLHDTDNKPLICRSLNPNAPNNNPHIYLTPNCLANYKGDENK